MPRIALYISGHGLGHAMRMKELLLRIREAEPGAEIDVAGSIPAWVFAEPPAVAVRLRALRCDVGAVQRDSLHLDVRRTLEENAEFYRGIGRLAEQEAEYLRAERIGLVVGDIPPLAFLAASRAGLRSVAVGNFSWDWIYEEYAAAHPGYRGVVETVRDAYARADLLLRLPFHGDMGAFRAVRDIPLIARPPRARREETRRALGIPAGDPSRVVFLSMGGHCEAEIRAGGRNDFGDYLYLSYFRPAARIRRLTVLGDRARVSHPDIVAASDCVISKPGYCTVAECIASRTPLAYTSRDNFREYAVMVEGIRRHCRARLLPRGDFHEGAWAPHLDALFADAPRGAWPPTPTNGAQVAAGIILGMARGGPQAL